VCGRPALGAPRCQPFSIKPAVADVTGESPLAVQEASIVESFKGHPLPTLECDTVLNSNLSPHQLLQVPAGGKLVLNFWTPTCGPCKPLLAELAALAMTKPPNLTFVSIVRSADLELEPPGEWQLLRVQGLMAKYKVGFPTCVHTSSDVTQRWQAGGVPLTLLVSADKGVERAACGGENGQRLLDELKGRTSSPR